ncbi:DUF2752 domain-containing protein [Antrihabitans cavernicola]|uniref:DUF2752 domain-containing protein n=2 Tax=Antrihabitans cavernicola TaxID=2495913 RepID=A0A5A7SFX2_9NOCA|nr:DUF2752 domain-containing protein [Spelaeibacter cavernicola]
MLRVRDPHVDGAYGYCPFHAITGWWCPACGGMRAINDLTHGDVVASLSSNIFVVPLLAVLLVVWVRWLHRRWQGSDIRPLSIGTRTVVVVVVVATVFTIVRNTPWGSWLAPA